MEANAPPGEVGPMLTGALCWHSLPTGKVERRDEPEKSVRKARKKSGLYLELSSKTSKSLAIAPAVVATRMQH